MVKKEGKLTVIDLFCGAGGLSLGFANGGFDIILGVDNDKYSLQTFGMNFKNSRIVNMDLFNFNPLEFKNILDEKKIDVVIGGPPCQGFSLTGTRREDDPRNKLYKAFFEIVRLTNPKAFLIENVPGMGKLYEGKVKEDIYNKADKLGYNVGTDILTAADFGVPQMRKRIFFVGVKKNIGPFTFPEKINKDQSHYITCEEAIGDLPALDQDFMGEEVMDYNSEPKSNYQKEIKGKNKKLFNHVATRHTEHVKKVISHVPEGGNYKDLPKGIGESRKFHEAWTRYHSKKPSKTIDTGHRNHFHYKYNRVPTVRENARLQSFNDAFIFVGPKTQQYKQVGNAVPPKMAYYIAKKIKRVISNDNKSN